MEVMTVADDLAVLFDGTEVHRFSGLRPDADYVFHGQELRTLARPGELLCRFATVNDVHFGEVECGRIDDHPIGPIVRAAPGEPPYPETMNRAAISEITAVAPAAVIVKGDLTSTGTPEEFAAFEARYRGAFGDRLHVVRGNHDAYQGQDVYSGDRWIELPGVVVALMDTVVPFQTGGAWGEGQMEWLDALAAESDRPVIVMGHHPQSLSGAGDAAHFNLSVEATEQLTDVIARRRSIIAYTSGHTHRHRTRQLGCGVPTIEIGCVKDFPGTWAEYRVYDRGVMQVVHRISAPDALSWSERCRHLYADFGVDYEHYAMGQLEDRCLVIPTRG